MVPGIRTTSLRERADAGDPEAQYCYALRLLEQSAKLRARTACQWLEKSALQGHEKARWRLDNMKPLLMLDHLANTDVPWRAAPFVIARVIDGDTENMLILAGRYLFGKDNVPQNLPRAGEWLRCAAAAGHVGAMLKVVEISEEKGSRTDADRWRGLADETCAAHERSEQTPFNCAFCHLQCKILGFWTKCKSEPREQWESRLKNRASFRRVGYCDEYCQRQDWQTHKQHATALLPRSTGVFSSIRQLFQPADGVTA